MIGRDPTVIEGALVLTLDDEGTAGHLDIAIADGRIALVGLPAEVRDAYPDAQRFDARDRVIMPGLVNAHLHPEMHILKGVAEDRSLHAWPFAYRLNRGLDLLGTDEGRALQRAAIRASFSEAILAGTTTVAAYGVTVGADEVTAEELVRSGLRGFVTIRDVAFQPALDAAGARVVPASLLKPPRMYRLHAEEALFEPEIESAAAAHTRGERIVMHAAETAHRVQLLKDRFGDSTIRILHHYGLLSERMLLSHAVHVDAEEIALIAGAGAHVVSSPSAEMKLADGIAPIVAFLEAGVNVALGTDCAVCNNSNDMFLECRQLGLSQKVTAGAEHVPAHQILRCATSAGARALGWGDRLGTITAGLAADLILVDAMNPRMQPLVHGSAFSNVAANVVYAATGQDVTDVMVGGEWLVRDRRLTRCDGDKIVRDLARAASTLYDRVG